jgi:hypothetical protein
MYKMGGRCPVGHNTDPRNTMMEETSRQQRRMEASYEGGRSPEGVEWKWNITISFFILSQDLRVTQLLSDVMKRGNLVTIRNNLHRYVLHHIYCYIKNSIISHWQLTYFVISYAIICILGRHNACYRNYYYRKWLWHFLIKVGSEKNAHNPEKNQSYSIRNMLTIYEVYCTILQCKCKKNLEKRQQHWFLDLKIKRKLDHIRSDIYSKDL